MTTDYRALCAELLSALESEGYAHWVKVPDEDELCLRARAALAEEPPVPAPPADGEVAKLAAWLRMQGDAQKPGPNSLLGAKTKKERRTNGARLTRAAELLERLQELENNG